jgi:hypothetical protein
MHLFERHRTKQAAEEADERAEIRTRLEEALAPYGHPDPPAPAAPTNGPARQRPITLGRPRP